MRMNCKFRNCSAFERGIFIFRSMHTEATQSFLSAQSQNSEHKAGCPNLGHATLYIDSAA